MGTRGSVAEKKFRLEKVRRRYAKGQTVQEMADAMEVSTVTINSDLRIIHRQAEQEARKPTIEHAAQMLERIEEIWRTCWEAFAVSKGDVVVTTLRADSMEEWEDPDTGKKSQRPKDPKSTMTRKKSAGDPRFMERAGWAWLQRCELLGLIRKASPGMNANNEQTPGIGEVGMVVFLPPNGRDMHLQTNAPEKKKDK